MVPSLFFSPLGSFSEENLFLSLLIVLLIPLVSKTFGYQFNSPIVISFIGKARLVRVKASISSTSTLSHQFLLENWMTANPFKLESVLGFSAVLGVAIPVLGFEIGSGLNFGPSLPLGFISL